MAQKVFFTLMCIASTTTTTTIKVYTSIYKYIYKYIYLRFQCLLRKRTQVKYADSNSWCCDMLSLRHRSSDSRLCPQMRIRCYCWYTLIHRSLFLPRTYIHSLFFPVSLSLSRSRIPEGTKIFYSAKRPLRIQIADRWWRYSTCSGD